MEPEVRCGREEPWGSALETAEGLRPSCGLGSHWRVLSGRVTSSDLCVQSFPGCHGEDGWQGKGKGREPRRRPLQRGTCRGG